MDTIIFCCYTGYIRYNLIGTYYVMSLWFCYFIIFLFVESKI
jgi:hypothetical protein